MNFHKGRPSPLHSRPPSLFTGGLLAAPAPTASCCCDIHVRTALPGDNRGQNPRLGRGLSILTQSIAWL